MSGFDRKVSLRRLIGYNIFSSSIKKNIFFRFLRLNIVSISTKLPATTESDCHYEKNVIEVDYEGNIDRFENENLDDEDIEPKYISDMRKNNAKIIEKYDQEIKHLKETIYELQKKVDCVLDEREKTRQLLDKKLEKEIIKWKKSNGKKLKRLTRRCQK